MSAISKIGWTQATWNPLLGCSKISPGCRGCYAIKDVHRMAGNPNLKIKAANEGLTIIQGGEANWTGKVRLIPERLDIPLRTRKPTTYFVNSLSDLFHESVSFSDVDLVFDVMRKAHHWRDHRFQILTKRSERLMQYGMERARVGWPSVNGNGRLNETVREMREFQPGIWLGVSVESRDYLSRIDHLRRTPAAVRFLSIEPLLEDLGDIRGYLEGFATPGHCRDIDGSWWHAAGSCAGCTPSIDWVICGGESGKDARPMHPDWVRSIRDQCQAARVPFFFKQHGNWVSPANIAVHGAPGRQVWLGRAGSVFHPGPGDDAKDAERRTAKGIVLMRNVGKKAAGRTLDGRTWDQMPMEVGSFQAVHP